MLAFDANKHTYTLDGECLPSVTQVMGPIKDFSMVPPGVLERKRQYGINVHAMVEKEIREGVSYDEIPEGLTPAIEAFWRWQEDHPAIAEVLPKAILERAMAHKRFGYAGKPDIILDGWMVIDIKTRAADKLTDGIQCAAYEELWKANGGTKHTYEHRTLTLNTDGTYKFVKVNDKEALNRFRLLLDHFNNAKTINSWRNSK